MSTTKIANTSPLFVCGNIVVLYQGAPNISMKCYTNIPCQLHAALISKLVTKAMEVHLRVAIWTAEICACLIYKMDYYCKYPCYIVPQPTCSSYSSCSTCTIDEIPGKPSSVLHALGNFHRIHGAGIFTYVNG